MTEVLIEKRGPVQWITINREERRNAMNDVVTDSIAAGFASASADRICSTRQLSSTLIASLPEA
jgi:enoyl-CoA hydratase/carnithine racemase